MVLLALVLMAISGGRRQAGGEKLVLFPFYPYGRAGLKHPFVAGLISHLSKTI